jgi:phage-related minor tail protein
MDEEIEKLVVSVRADTAGFARDVKEMRSQLEGPFAAGAERAGRMLETALVRAIRTGKIGFDDLKRIALSAMEEIAAAAIRSGIGAVLGGGKSGGGKGGGIGSLVAGLLGLPGRASGGPVAPGRAYLVGERGPELFVPTSSGKVEPGRGRGARDVRISISVSAPGGAEPRALAQSSRQVARAVKRALLEIED